ncbi:MAG: DUF4097 family beta strand repeat protein [Phycisphaerae bacterium]|nr:DUF4097 family beta strand repeat protein [Phycisphaerae bacterium]
MRPSLKGLCELLVLTAMTFSLGACESLARYRETRSSQAPCDASKPVQVETANGAIVIRKGEVAEAEIRANLRTTSIERLAATRVIAETTPGGTLRIGVRWPGERQGDEGCDFDIVVPGAMGLTLQAQNGRISVSGLSGVATLSTSNGAISVEGQSGAVKARSSNGDITVREASDRVDAATSNGSITIDMAPAAIGPVIAETTNGSIRLRVSPKFSGKIEASTSNGEASLTGFGQGLSPKVISESRRSFIATFSDVGAPSCLTTSNGSVVLSPRN